MGWKGFKTQSETIEYPPTTGITHVHNHNHTPSAVGEAVGKALLYGSLAVAGWYAGVFLMSKAGFSDPESAMAGTLVWGTLGFILVLFVSRAAGEQIARYYAHQEAMEDRRTEQLRYQQLMMSSVVTDSRVIGAEDSRLTALAYEMMRQAYAYHLKNNAPFAGKWRPWSRRNAAEIRLPGETKPVGETMASKATAWLINKEVIVDDQINLKYYPDLGSIQRLLYQPPVLIAPQTQKGADNE